MAQEVAAQFTPTQLDDYGNIILSGYATTGPNTTGKMSWAWPDSPLLPAVPLPAVTSVQPVLKGWTTNYQEYYTQLPVNAYGVNPGDPTMFEYDVHSFAPAQGNIVSVGGLEGGSGYTPGSYTNVPAIGTRGVAGTLDIVVDATGVVISATPNVPGNLYAVGDGLTAGPIIGPGTGFAVFVTAISQTLPAGRPQWAQPPHRLINQQVVDFVPPGPNQQAIQYSAILYPVADNLNPPPIDIL